jgi:hypothetical protein
VVSNERSASRAAQLTTRIIVRPKGRSKARVGHGNDVAGVSKCKNSSWTVSKERRNQAETSFDGRR